MTYPFVQALHYSPGKMAEPRALIWHMAEGYGTVGYFERTTRQVSAHFVVERSGRIVQMVKLTDASWTQHVAFDADDNDAADCGIYSAVIGKAVLGTGWSDVNRYAIGIEVEGYREDGPNAAQVDAIASLYRDLRGRLRTLRGNLGHRDVQDYKSCPGCKFPWSRIGGHGLFSTEDPMGLAVRLGVTADADPYNDLGTAKVKGAGHYAFRVRDRKAVALSDGTDLGVVQKGVMVGGTLDAQLGQKAATGDRSSIVAFTHDGELHVALLADVAFTALVKPTTDTAAIQLAARRAEWDRIETGASVLLPARP